MCNSTNTTQTIYNSVWYIDCNFVTRWVLLLYKVQVLQVVQALTHQGSWLDTWHWVSGLLNVVYSLHQQDKSLSYTLVGAWPVEKVHGLPLTSHTHLQNNLYNSILLSIWFFNYKSRLTFQGSSARRSMAPYTSCKNCNSFSCLSSLVSIAPHNRITRAGLTCPNGEQ